MKKLLTIVALVSTLSLISYGDNKSTAATESKKQPAAQKADKELSQLVIRFMKAVICNNKGEIEKLIIPNKDASILWEGPAFPPGAQKQYCEIFDKASLEEAQIGETISVPGENPFVVTKEHVGKDKKLLWLIVLEQKGLFPFPVVKINDEWKVDPYYAIKDAQHRAVSAFGAPAR